MTKMVSPYVSSGIISMERERKRQDVTTSCPLEMRGEIGDDFGESDREKERKIDTCDICCLIFIVARNA